ncbi:MAG: hypothetical protein UDG86_04135 [Lachnospiraceae bacterium]|jgi:putative membrane protein|nr:hypothetical protein [Lachnospiraceae bacterium]
MNKNRRAVKTAAASLAVLMAGSTCFGNMGYVYAAGENTEKEETVYVKADTDGSTDKVIVSNWLKNPDGKSQLIDHADLTEIENVKGDESFTKNGNQLTWEAGGKDIYYQGESNRELPVEVKVTYYLDGREILGEDLAGKSGKVKLRFDYVNKSKEGEVYTPFTMVTGVILPTEHFSNVQAENGKVISDGSKNIVVGMGFPGLSDSLRLSDSELTEEVELPDHFEITADAQDFTLSMTATVAATGDLEQFGFDEADSWDDLKDSIEELKDASSELVDGSGELADGVKTLQDACVTLVDGMNTVDEKMGELSQGISTLDSKKGELINGLNTLAKGISTLNSKKGELTKGMDALASGSKELKTGNKKLETGVMQYTSGVDQLARGISQYTAGASSLEAGISQYTAGADQLASGVWQYTAGGDALAKGTAGYVAGTESLVNGIRELDAGIDAQRKALSGQGGSEKSGDAVAKAGEAKSAADQMKEAMKLADSTISSLETSIAQNQAVLDTLLDVQGRLGEIPSDLISKVSDTYSSYVGALGTSISYLQNDIAIQQSSLSAWKDFKNTADLDGLSNTLNTIQKSTKSGEDVSAAYAAGYREGASSALDSISGSVKTILKGANQLTANDDQLTAGAKALQNTAPALQEGAKNLAGKSSTLNAGIQELTGSNGQLTGGVKQLTDKSAELNSGAKQASEGAAALASGSVQLQTGVTALGKGIGELAAGSSRLTKGAGTLSDGIGTLAAGSAQLKEGTATLADGGSQLGSGVEELSDGANTLKDGMKEFDEDGIHKLTDLVEVDVQDILDRLDQVMDAGKAYHAFTGDNSNENSSVKFIIETAGISED